MQVKKEIQWLKDDIKHLKSQFDRAVEIESESMYREQCSSGGMHYKKYHPRVSLVVKAILSYLGLEIHVEEAVSHMCNEQIILKVADNSPEIADFIIDIVNDAIKHNDLRIKE